MFILVYLTSRMYVHNVYTSLFNQYNVRSKCIYVFISPVECTCTVHILVYLIKIKLLVNGRARDHHIITDKQSNITVTYKVGNL